MSELGIITEHDIRKAIRALEAAPKMFDNGSFYVPMPHWALNRERYRGIGRPRRSDYDWIDIPAQIRALQKKYRKHRLEV